MQQVYIDQFEISGLTIRTTNSAEQDPAKGKIGQLWLNYFSIFQTLEKPPEHCYGVYSNFESNENGAFDVTAGIKDTSFGDKSTSLTVASGTYLRFEKSGTMPAAVIELWQDIWQFFKDEKAPKRSYKCDFEEYQGERTVYIYIGIEGELND